MLLNDKDFIHYYFYYNDEEFGWMFLKIQTWFPYNIQIYLNGQEYLSRLLSKEDWLKLHTLLSAAMMSISFFGRNVEKIHTFRKGEIISDLRHRYQGYRIKFKINKDQIKMYNKGNNLRIEVTINNPKDFKILKEKENVQDREMMRFMEGVPMGKSIANLYQYVEISKTIIKRYLVVMPDILMEKVSEKRSCPFPS